MNLNKAIRSIAQRWKSTLGVTLGFGTLAALGTATVAPTYSATAQVFVSTQGQGSNADMLQGSNFTKQRVESYAAIANSPRVLKPVVDELLLETSASALSAQVSAAVPRGTVLVNLTAKSKQASQASEIANSVASSFAKVVSDLERSAAQQASTVNVSVVRPATVPSSPTSPNWLTNICGGLFLGLGAGCAQAMLRQRFDTAVRSSADVDEILDLPVLGTIFFDKDCEAAPISGKEDKFSPRSEAFRQLRTNLQFVEATAGKRIFLVTSSIPGEGKTTTSTNLALALSQNGLRVCLVDADLRRPRVGATMGLEQTVGLTTVLIGRASINDVLQKWGDDELYVLPSGESPPNPSELLGSASMQDVLDDLSAEFDVVLLDAPPLLPVADASILSGLVNGTLLVVGCGRASRHDLKRAKEMLGTVDARVHGVVLNRVERSSVGTYGYGYGYGNAEQYGYAPVSMPQPSDNNSEGDSKEVRLEPKANILRS